MQHPQGILTGMTTYSPPCRPISRRVLLAHAVAAAGGIAAHRGRTYVRARDSEPLPSTDFLRMLAFVPAPLDRWQYQITYAAPGAVRARWGMDDLTSYADVQARGLSTARFASLLSGCFDSPFAYNGLDTDGTERGAFGYDFYQVTREICAGEPPMFLDTRTVRGPPTAFARIEGAFDPDVVTAAVRAGGYTDADHAGTTYFTALDDNAADLVHIQSRLFPARRDRLVVDNARIIAAPATALMTDALDVENGQIPALNSDAVLRALAYALGDVASVATLPPDYTDRSIVAARIRSRSSIGTAQSIAQGLRESTGGWKALRPSVLLSVAVTDAGVLRRTLHLARVYADPADAHADAPEIVARLAGYRVFPGGGNALVAGSNLFTLRVETHAGRGILVVDAPLVTAPDLNPAWVQVTVESLLPFFALADPETTIRDLEAAAP